MDKLLESGEAVESRNRHLDYILKLPDPPNRRCFVRRASPGSIKWKWNMITCAPRWNGPHRIKSGKSHRAGVGAGQFLDFTRLQQRSRGVVPNDLSPRESLPDLAATRAELYAVLGWSAIFSGNHKLARAAAEAGLRLATQADRQKSDRALAIRLPSYLQCTWEIFPPPNKPYRQAKRWRARWATPNELAMILVLGGQIQFFAGGDICSSQTRISPKPSL